MNCRVAMFLALVVHAWAPMGASAQIEGLADAQWRPALERGMRAYRAERWEEATRELATAYYMLADFERVERFDFGCELGVAWIRHGESLIGRRRIADVVAESTDADRVSCLAAAADALAAMGQTEDAAHLYLQALGGRPAPAIRASYERLPEPVRRAAEVARRRMDSEPIAALVGTAASVDALAEALAQWTWRAHPTRIAQCSSIFEWAGSRYGLILCSYEDAPDPMTFGGRSYPLESFLWARSSRGARVRASFPSGTSFDCEAGHQERRLAPERLTTRAHGVEGWLLRVEDTQMTEPALSGPLTRTFAYACTFTSGSCVRVEESIQRCSTAESGRERCSGYRGHAAVRRGLLTIRIDEGQLPPALQHPVDLTSLAAPRPVRTDERRSRATSMRGCRVEVFDRHSALNVRVHPSARAAVVGALDHGTEVQVARNSHGRWVHLVAPLRGWVWSANLRRRCEPSTAPP